MRTCSSMFHSDRRGRSPRSAGGRTDCGRRRRGGPARRTGGPSPAPPPIAFNAQAMTIAAQIAAAEASGRSTGDTGGSVAGRTPALRSARRAASGGTDFNELAGGMPGGHEARPALPGRPGMAAVRGRAGAGPGRAGGEGWCQSRCPVNRRRNRRVKIMI